MKPSRKTPAPTRPASRPAATGRRAAPGDLQPPATGVDSGSPAAPVMKQFQKTRSESSGRS